MDAERTLTIAVVALFAGSTALFVVLTVVGALTDGADLLRFGTAGVSGFVAAVAVGWHLARRTDPDRLTGR